MERKYDLTKIFEVKIVKLMSDLFKVGMYATCQYTSVKGDFILEAATSGEPIVQAFGFAYQSCFHRLNWMDIAEKEFSEHFRKADSDQFIKMNNDLTRKFGESVHKKVEEHILRERKKQKDKNPVIEDGKFKGQPIYAYPATEKECYLGPDSQDKKLKSLNSLARDLYPDFNYKKLSEVMHDIVQKRSKLMDDLKNRSPYYPGILKEIHGNEKFYSTLVRIQRLIKNPAGKMTYYWYAIHAVEYYDHTKVKCPMDEDFVCITRLIDQAYKIQLFYKNPFDNELDCLQISEKDRFNQGLTK